MKKVHVSAVTAAILASAVMVSQVNATDIVSPAYVKSGDAGIPPAVYLMYGNTPYWDMAGGPNNYRLYDHINDNPVFIVNTSTSDANSIVVGPSGGIGLANNAVYIDRAQKQMGIGTNTPEDTLHIKSQYSGNLILEKEGTSKWKLGTTTTGGIVLMDMRNSNTIPFWLDGNAPADSLHIRGDGNVGLGVGSPTVKLDVHGKIWNDDVIGSAWSGSNTVDDGLTNLLVLSANNSEADKESDAGFGLKNARADIQWNFRTHQDGTAFVATLAGTGGPEFTVKNATANVSGTELYLGNGAKNVGGVWINASSRALKENIKPLSTKEALTAFNKLQPVTYNYKSDKKEQVVGFIAEDVPELVAINSRDGLSSMDMVAVLTKVVQEQDKTLTETKSELKKAQEKIAKLETMQKRLAKVESLLTNLALNTSNSKTEKVSLNSK